MARHNGGYVKAWRSMWDGDLADNPILFALWNALLQMAMWKEGKILWEGAQRPLPPGSVVFGIREIASRWNTSPKTIIKHLRYLRDTGRISLETGTRGSIATICNWEGYQGELEEVETPRKHLGNARVTPGEHEVNLSEEGKKERTEEGKKREGAKPLPRLAQIWNEHCGNLPKVRACGRTREKHAETRWRDNPDEAYWTDVIQRISRSPFCTGNNKTGWRADFDFLIQPETQHKVLEGKYDAHSAPIVEAGFFDFLPGASA